MASGVYKWMAIDRIGTTVITFTGNIVLARLLTPFDFGLLAMVAIFTGIANNLSGCGLSDGLIHKLHPTENDYSTVFVFNVSMGLLLGAMFILMSKPIAAYFNHEQLIGIMRAIGICFFFNSLVLTQETRMRKELSIKKMCIVRISANVCAVALGIWLALNGYSYWGLVSCRVFLSFFLFIFYVSASRWIPRIAFYTDSFKEMFGYGVNLMWAYMLTTISKYINTSVLGKQSSAASGLYSQAQKLEEVPFTLTETIFNWPFFAVASNESDAMKRRTLCREMLQWLSMLNVTAGMLMMLLSSPAFICIYGEKWIGAIPIFRILIIYGIASSLKYFFQTILKLHGKTAIIRNYTIAEVAIQLIMLGIAYSHGVIAIAWSQIFAPLVILCIYMYKCRLLENESWRELLGDMFSPLIIPSIAFGITAAAYMLWNGFVNPFISCLGIVFLFIGSAVLLWECFPQPIYLKYRNRLLSNLHFKKS